METLVTCTTFTVARAKGPASHDRSKPELPGKGLLQCLRSSPQQTSLLPLEIVDQLIHFEAHR